MNKFAFVAGVLGISLGAWAFPAVQTIERTLEASDPVQTGRLTRAGKPRTKTYTEPCIINTNLGDRRYQAHTFTNDESKSITVSVDLTDLTTPASTAKFFHVAYTNYNPAALCDGFLGDPAQSPSNLNGEFTVGMAFEVEPGQSFTIVVHEVDVGQGIGFPYRLTLSRNKGATITQPGAGGLLTFLDNANASIYPVTYSVDSSETLATVNELTFNIAGLTHSFPGDIDMLLQSPFGYHSIVISDVGGTGDVSNLNFSIGSLGAALLGSTGGIAAGLHLPTDISPGSDVFPLPAPTGPYTANFDEFKNRPMNGEWKMFARDDAGADTGSMAASALQFRPKSPVVYSAPVAPVVARGERVRLAFLSVADNELPNHAVEAEPDTSVFGADPKFLSIENKDGSLEGVVEASCDAVNGLSGFKLGGLGYFQQYGILTTVTDRVPPTNGTYATTLAVRGQDMAVIPVTPPSDGGSISEISVSASASFTGTLSASTDGVITIQNPGPKGKHTISVSVKDNCGDSSPTVSTFALMVGIPGDTDGDGMGDELEVALGSSPTDFDSVPSGFVPGTTAEVLNLSKSGAKLNFAKANGDSISLSGTIALTAGFPLAGQPFVVDFGGVIRQFTLNAKGTAKVGGDSLKITAKKDKSGVVTADQFAKFTVKIAKSSFSALLADEGLTGAANAKKETRAVRTQIFFASKIFAISNTYLYSAKAGLTGVATSVKGSGVFPAANAQMRVSQLSPEASAAVSKFKAAQSRKAVAMQVTRKAGSLAKKQNGEVVEAQSPAARSSVKRADPVAVALSADIVTEAEAVKTYGTLRECAYSSAKDYSSQTRAECQAKIEELSQRYDIIRRDIEARLLPASAFLSPNQK